jgi:hypothetical protein
MNRYLLCLIVLCGCTSKPDDGARARGKAVAVVELAAVLNGHVDVQPAPQPKPGVCPSCDGRGVSGDGLSPCNECGGDGKIESKSEPIEVPTIHPELTKVRPTTPKPAAKRLSPSQVATLYVKNQYLLDSYRLPGESNESLVERFLKSNKKLDPRVKKQYPGYPTRSKSGRYWHQNGHPPTREHLANEHGFDINWLRTLNQAQLNALHSDAHDAELRSVRWNNTTYRESPNIRPTSRCPGGVCPSPSSGRFRLFR